MSEDLHRIHDMLAAFFMVLSPAVFVAVFVVLLGLGLWITRRAWHSQRVARAVANAPLVDLRSNVGGLVKFRGTAQPRPQSPAGALHRSSGTHARAGAAATVRRSPPPTTF
ncbi:MAG: hypothetical protein IPF94_11095 [Betaproteobacteria bacterium]|nr:hypothetical protein [Betaproteobacteria bacterium]